MPQIPYDAIPSVEAQPLPGRPYPHVDTDVNATSFGSGLAAGIEDVGAAGASAEAKIKEQNDHLRVIDANTQLEAAMNSMQYGTVQPDGTRSGGAFSLHGAAALNLPATLMPEYEKAAAQVNSTLTPDQQRLFAPHMANARQQLNLQLNRHEYEESNRLAQETFTNSVSQSVENASVGWRDPMALGKARLDIKGAMDIQADRQGWSADEKNVQTNKALAEMHFNVVDRMLSDGQPNAALKYFQDVRDTQELTGQQAHQLGATIDAAFREARAENQVVVGGKLRDVSAAAMNGLAVPPSSMPSRAEVLAAFPKDGERRYSGMLSDITLGADVNSMAGKTPEQIQTLTDSYRPTTVAGAADAFERYNAVGKAADQIFKARNQDPAQFAMDYGLGWKPLDVGKPQEMLNGLRSRATTQGEVSEVMGVNTPLLSKQETKQFTAWLDNQKPSDRLQALTALRSNLPGDQAYTALMKQIAPGSPITAVAGSMLDKPASTSTPSWYDGKFAVDPIVPQRMLEGEQILKAKDEGITSKFPMPSDKDLQAHFQSAAGGANSDLFRGRPETLETAFASYKSLYAAEASHQGISNGIINTTIAQAAAESVISGGPGRQPATYGNTSVVVPAGMDPTKFEGVVDRASKSALMAGGYSDKDIAALRGYGLRELGDTLGTGRYVIINGNGDPLKSKTGQTTVVIDLNKVRTQHASGAPEEPVSGGPVFTDVGK